MKSGRNIYTVLTIIAVATLPSSCKHTSKKSESETLRSYKIAQESQDYQSAVAFLEQMAAEDSASEPWIYDSLAYYHYFYLITPGVVKPSHTARYFAQRGLELNPQNNFLLELKAKLDLGDEKIELAQASFQSLWNKTHDYTYLWVLTYLDATSQGGARSADSVVSAVLANPESEKKTVRLEFPQERIQETVPAKAAFIYLRASFKLEKNQFQEAANLLQEAMKIAPDFYGAKRMIYMMQQQQQQGGARN